MENKKYINKKNIPKYNSIAAYTLCGLIGLGSIGGCGSSNPMKYTQNMGHQIKTPVVNYSNHGIEKNQKQEDLLGRITPSTLGTADLETIENRIRSYNLETYRTALFNVALGYTAAQVQRSVVRDMTKTKIGEPGKDGIGCSATNLEKELIITCGEQEYRIPHGMDGQNCTIDEVPLGAYVTCGDNSVFIRDGIDGRDGTDGKDGEVIFVPIDPDDPIVDDGSTDRDTDPVITDTVGPIDPVDPIFNDGTLNRDTDSVLNKF